MIAEIVLLLFVIALHIQARVVRTGGINDPNHGLTLNTVHQEWLAERNAQACPDYVQYKRDIIVEFKGCKDNLNQERLTMLADRFVVVYNDMNFDRQDNLCDPYFREIVSAAALLDDVNTDFLRSHQDGRRKLDRNWKTKEFGGEENQYVNIDRSKKTKAVDQKQRRQLDEDDDDGGGGYNSGTSGSGSRNDDEGEVENGDEWGNEAGDLEDVDGVGDENEDHDEGGDEDDADDGVGDENEDHDEGGDEDDADDGVDYQNLSGDSESLSLELWDTEDSTHPGNESESTCYSYFQVRFRIVARCRHCDFTPITIFNDVTDVLRLEDLFGRRLRKENLMIGGDQVRDSRIVSDSMLRRAQDNQCTCPSGLRLRAPTEGEMTTAFDMATKDLFEALAVPVLEVEDVIEVEEVMCEPTPNNFTTQVELSFAALSNDTSQVRLSELARNFQASYNQLANRFCDPLFRQVANVDLLNQTVSPLTSGRRDLLLLQFNISRGFNFLFQFRISFFITGICRGCPSMSLLFNDAARRLDLSRGEIALDESATASMRPSRFLQGEQCYCAAVDSSFGAPSERHFTERFQTDLLANLGLPIEALTVYNDETVERPPPIIHNEVCSINSDCPFDESQQVCVNTRCVHDGNPRISLTWEGDDDLDLSVTTPKGVEIWYNNDFDEESGGVFDTSYVQDVLGNHTENVYFRMGEPRLTYTIKVRTHVQRGSADAWTVEVRAFGRMKYFKGIGDEEFSYIFK